MIQLLEQKTRYINKRLNPQYHLYLFQRLPIIVINTSKGDDKKELLFQDF